MVRHDHAVIADLAIRPQGPRHIDVAIVGHHFCKFEETAADIAEVHVEDFPPAPEIPDHVVNLIARFLQHLGDRALTKVQSVIGTRRSLDEALQPIDGAQHRLNAAPTLAFRHAWILGMQRDLHLRLLGHGHHALQKIFDPIPIDLLGYPPGLRERRLLLADRIVKRAHTRSAAPRRSLRAHDADERKIVFHHRDARLAGAANHGANIVDRPVTRRIFGEQDLRHLGSSNRRGGHRQRHTIERDSKRLDVLPQAAKCLETPRLLNVAPEVSAADTRHAKRRERPQRHLRVVVLVACFHQHRPTPFGRRRRGRGRRLRSAGQAQRRGTHRGGGHKSTPPHGSGRRERWQGRWQAGVVHARVKRCNHGAALRGDSPGRMPLKVKSAGSMSAWQGRLARARAGHPARSLTNSSAGLDSAQHRLDTRLLLGLFGRSSMNLNGTTLVSTLAHLSVVAVSVVSVSAINKAPRGF